MDESTTREKILKKVRNALIYKSENIYSDIDFTSNVYKDFEDSLDIVFAEEFTKLGGNFIYCENEQEFIYLIKEFASDKSWTDLFCKEEELIFLLGKAGLPYKTDEKDFLTATTGITFCEYLIARFGSIMLSSRQSSGRRLLIYPDTHIVVGFTSQLVAEINDAISGIKEKYQNSFPSFITMVSGPSRTADIEKTIVMGAHGPKELYLFLIDDLLDNDKIAGS
jgi:L-lactate dehydrogenase complex protein LldG